MITQILEEMASYRVKHGAPYSVSVNGDGEFVICYLHNPKDHRIIFTACGEAVDVLRDLRCWIADSSVDPAAWHDDHHGYLAEQALARINAGLPLTDDQRAAWEVESRECQAGGSF